MFAFIAKVHASGLCFFSSTLSRTHAPLPPAKVFSDIPTATYNDQIQLWSSYFTKEQQPMQSIRHLLETLSLRGCWDT